MDGFNNDDDDNNNNSSNNILNMFIMYYWLNFYQHWYANRITGRLNAVHNVGYSDEIILPSPNGISYHSNSVVLCDVRTDLTIDFFFT